MSLDGRTAFLQIQQTGTTDYRLTLRVPPCVEIPAKASVTDPDIGSCNVSASASVQPQSRQAARRIGSAIWDTWLSNDVGRALYTWVEEQPPTSAEPPSRLVISVDGCIDGSENRVSEILGLPWELMRYDDYYPIREKHLAVWRTAGEYDEPGQIGPPVRSWFGLSCPADQPQGVFDTLRCSDNLDELLDYWGIYATDDSGVWHPATAADFADALDGWNVVYFIGHGEVHATHGAQIALSDDDGLCSAYMTAKEIARCISPTVRLLVLNCCHSAEIAVKIYRSWQTKGNTGACPPVIVAVQWELAPGNAYRLQEQLIRSLVRFEPGGISNAVRRLRNVLQSPGNAAEIDWATPFVLAPSIREVAQLDALEQPVRVMAEVTSPDGGPSNGSIGLTEDQAVAVRRRLMETRDLPEGLRAAMEQFLDEQSHDRDCRIAPFGIDTHPVTVQRWEQVIAAWDGEQPPPEREVQEGEQDDWPVRVTAESAMRFCRHLGVRLPSPREWERAARGTSESILPWTDDLEHGWTSDGAMACNVEEAGTAGVTGVFETAAGSSSHGVADMVGNVPEWVKAGEGNRYRVMGSGWTGPLAANVPSFSRNREPSDTFGFRCVRDLQ